MLTKNYAEAQALYQDALNRAREENTELDGNLLIAKGVYEIFMTFLHNLRQGKRPKPVSFPLPYLDSPEEMLELVLDLV